MHVTINFPVSALRVSALILPPADLLLVLGSPSSCRGLSSWCYDNPCRWKHVTIALYHEFRQQSQLGQMPGTTSAPKVLLWVNFRSCSMTFWITARDENWVCQLQFCPKMEGGDNTGFESGHILIIAYCDIQAAQIHALYGGNMYSQSFIYHDSS